MEILESFNDVINISDTIEANSDWKEYNDSLSLTDSITKLFTSLPANFSATQGTHHDKVRVSWDEVTDATEYRIYRDGILLIQTQELSYDDETADQAVLSLDGLVANEYPTRVDLSLDNFSVEVNSHSYQISVYKDGVWSGLSSSVEGWRGYTNLDIKWYKDDGSGYSLISDENTFTIEYTGTPDPPVPETIDSGDILVTETVDYVMLSFPEPISNAGDSEDFKVIINADGCDEIESNPISAGKSAAPITKFKITRNGTVIIDDLEVLTYQDEGARGSVGYDYIARASNGDYSNKVLLTLDYLSESPEEESYKVASYNISGWSDYSNAVTGTKLEGGLEFQWQVADFIDEFLELSDGTDLELNVIKKLVIFDGTDFSFLNLSDDTDLLIDHTELKKLRISSDFTDIPGATTADYDYYGAPTYPTKKFYRTKIVNQDGETFYTNQDEGWRGEGITTEQDKEDTLNFSDSKKKIIIKTLFDTLYFGEEHTLNIGTIPELYVLVDSDNVIFLSDEISYFIGTASDETLEDFIDITDEINATVLIASDTLVIDTLTISDSIEKTIIIAIEDSISFLDRAANKSYTKVYGYRYDGVNFFVPNTKRGFYTLITDLFRITDKVTKGKLYHLLDELEFNDWQLFQAELIGGPLEIYSRANKILQPAGNETKVDLYEVKKIFLKWFGSDAEDLFDNPFLTKNSFIQPARDVVLNALIGTLPSLKGEDMKAAIEDLNIERGAQFECEFLYKDIEDNFVNLSKFHVELIITDFRRNIEVMRISSKTPGDIESRIDISSGTFKVFIKASDTANLDKTKYRYQIDITPKDDNEKTDRLLKGILEVL